MPSARDHPFNHSRRPLLDSRPGPMGTRQLAHDDEDDDDEDYEDIHNNNTLNNTSSMNNRCDFKTYGFVRKFSKPAPMVSSSNNHNNNHSSSIYNGFHDFNAIPRANGAEDVVGYPYGEKIINEKQPIAGTNKYLNNHQSLPQQQHQTYNVTLSPKLNNQHVNLYNNNFNQQKIGNRSEPDFTNRPLPQTPTSIARQRTAVVPPRAVCPTPPMCRANRKGPFIFGVDGSNSSNYSSPAPSPLLSGQPTATAAPVIDQWKYSENNNNNSLQSSFRRRDTFQRTQKEVSGEILLNSQSSRGNCRVSASLPFSRVPVEIYDKIIQFLLGIQIADDHEEDDNNPVVIMGIMG